MDLAKYIRELILLNECVILPGFGGFETQYSAAKYDNSSKQMLPPTKQVEFRPDFITGSGVLEDHLCKCLNINNDQALLLVNEYVQQLKRNLENNNETLIAGVGLFTKGLGNTLNFSPFQEENYLVDSFGLEALPYHKASDYEAIESTPELKIKSRKGTLLFILVGLGIITMLLILTVFISSKFELYLFNIGDKTEQNDLIVIGGDRPSDSLHQQIDNTLMESTDLRSALHYSEQEILSDSKEVPEFFLIAGSFKTIKNAEAVKNELLEEGYMTEVIENQGYYRVSIANFSDKQEALKELHRLRRQLDRSVWLLQIPHSQ